MRSSRIAAGVCAALLAVGCHRSAPASTMAIGAERTVFTDSAMHARLCQSNAPGEDWRRVCTPLDQSATPVKPLPRQPDE